MRRIDRARRRPRAVTDPWAATTLRTATLVVRLDADGVVERAAHPVAGTTWLDRAGDVSVLVRGRALDLGPPRVSVDEDEVEVERSGAGLRVVVRHAVEQAWTVRLVLGNESDGDLVLEEVRLGWRAASGTVTTALAGGAAATYAVQPDGGDGPLLVGRLRAGHQTGVDETALRLGPLTLPAGHRVAAQWRWEVVDQPRRADPTGDLPRTSWLELGQTVVLAAGPDVAVVAPGLDVSVGEDSVEVGAPVPQTTTVELRSARGTRAYDLAWAPDLDAVLADAEVEALLAGPTTPAGTVRLPDAAAGLLVQDALRRRSAGSPDAALEALELVGGLTAEQVDERARSRDPADPLALALLAREADRAVGSAARAVLATATTALLVTRAPVPGLALAGIGLALAQLRAGPATDPVVAHLGALLAASTPADDAGLELAVLLRAGGGAGSAGDEALVAGLRRLGATLGAGLPGRVVPEVGLERVARSAAVLALVDEATGERLRHGWGLPVAELARRTAAQAHARVAGRPDHPAARPALAWLVLGRPDT